MKQYATWLLEKLYVSFLKRDNINLKTHCNICSLHLNGKAVSGFNENFVSLLSTLDSENWLKNQNSEGNKTVTTEVSWRFSSDR